MGVHCKSAVDLEQVLVGRRLRGGNSENAVLGHLFSPPGDQWWPRVKPNFLPLPFRLVDALEAPRVTQHYAVLFFDHAALPASPSTRPRHFFFAQFPESEMRSMARVTSHEKRRR